jgi:hypothetical protein
VKWATPPFNSSLRRSPVEASDSMYDPQAANGVWSRSQRLAVDEGPGEHMPVSPSTDNPCRVATTHRQTD